MEETKISIVSAEIEDVENIKGIMKTVVEGIEDTTVFVADEEAFIRLHIKEKGFTLLAKTIEGENVGFCMVRFPRTESDNLGKHLRFSEGQLEETAHIESVAILEKARGQQLQMRFLEKAEEMAKEKGYRYFFATVSPNNQVSLKNCCLAGYRIVDTVDKYGGLLRHILYKESKE